MTEIIEEIITSIGSFGPVLACLLIVLESIIPALPLCVFIVINFMTFGSILGLLISWFFTVVGCVIAYFIVRKGFQNWFNKKVRKNKKINKLMKKIDNFNRCIVMENNIKIPIDEIIDINGDMFNNVF